MFECCLRKGKGGAGDWEVDSARPRSEAQERDSLARWNAQLRRHGRVSKRAARRQYDQNAEPPRRRMLRKVIQPTCDNWKNWAQRFTVNTQLSLSDPLSGIQARR